MKVQITASRKPIYLDLVYRATGHPMMLATNIELRSKEDMVKVAELYFSRWSIEEYFRCKKQMFQFENFRVRKLKTINALNFYITLCMTFLATVSIKEEINSLKASIIQAADPVKHKVSFWYYRLIKGVCDILSYEKKASGYGSVQNIQNTDSSVLSWLPEPMQLEYVFESPVLKWGLLKHPTLPLANNQTCQSTQTRNKGYPTLTLKLHFTETQLFNIFN